MASHFSKFAADEFKNLENSTTSDVYLHVIEDVIKNLQPMFGGGSGEKFLNKLQKEWEERLINARFGLDLERSLKPTPEGSISPVYELNVPCKGTKEYETLNPNVLFPPVAKRINSKCQIATTEQKMLIEGASRISQLDGLIPEPYDDGLSTPYIYNHKGVVKKEFDILNTPAHKETEVATPAAVSQNDIADNDDEVPFDEDDCDDLDDPNPEEDLNTTNLVVALFDKVKHTKGRWKCTLRNGLMYINDKEILFKKATGQFDF